MQAQSSNCRARLWGLALLSALGAACSEQSVTVELRSLQASGDVSYVCRTPEGEGAPLSDCNVGAVFREQRDLYALVTQTSSGEVAVINVPLDPSDKRQGEGVVDIDPATPSYGFLHVGARPGDIVSTPEGRASFVATGEPGRPAIYGLPTHCLGAAKEDESPRDLTSWPACALPDIPGDMAVVLERPSADGCDRSLAEEPTLRTECSVTLTDPPDGTDTEPAALRKLVVALPDRGSLVVIDAQWLLNRPEGSFEPCKIQAELPLRVDLPATPISQRLPPDLETCTPSAPPTPPMPPAFQARPAGFSLSNDRLYVADSSAPVIHVVNLENTCGMREEPPLLPRSLENAARLVTTSKVSVSPLTPSGKRFVYAIDEFDWPASSVMAFDVSLGSSERTPIVRPGAPLLPFEAPDRIQFPGSPKDLTFVLRDRPEVDPATGNIAIGVSCEPDPRRSGDLGARYRASPDYTNGARPTELRGVFAMVLLTNGQISVIDVEDFDAPCRRPLVANPSSEPDFRGCVNDPELPLLGPLGEPIFADELGPTVTQEVSCRMVQPHRARAATLAITSDNLGVRAPALASFPQFRAPESALRSTFAERPKLLAVDFPGVGGRESLPASVFVGTTKYEPGSTRNSLVLDPALADRYSLALPFNEPRAYQGNEDLSLTYEGTLTRDLNSGFLQFEASTGTLRLLDPAVGFCDLGVNDEQLAKSLAEERFQSAAAELESFAVRHSDYLVITADFPEEDDAYWSESANRCGADRALCQATFQSFDATELAATREFRIRDAQQQSLELEARGEDARASDASRARAEERAKLASCCFPGGISYRLRASQQWVLRGPGGGFRHDIVAARQKDANGADILECVRDCNPRKRYFDARVLEIAVAPGQPGDTCVLESASGPVRLSEPAARCIHQTPTARFAVYRGPSPSIRDMAFTWRTIGGFSPLRFDLAALSTGVAPQTIVSLPGFDWLTVVDAAPLGLGLTILNLDSLTAMTPTLN